MKRIIAYLLVVVLLLGTFSGCAKKSSDQKEAAGSGETVQQEDLAVRPLEIPEDYQEAVKESIIMICGSDAYYVNGERVSIDEPTPRYFGEEFYVAASFLAKATDGDYFWNESQRTAEFSAFGHEITAAADSAEVLFDGEKKSLEFPTFAIDDKVMVPLQGVGKMLNKSVHESGEVYYLTDPENGKRLSEDFAEKGRYGSLIAAELGLNSSAANAIRSERDYSTRLKTAQRIYYAQEELPFKTGKDVLVAQTGGLYVEDVNISEADAKGNNRIQMTVYNMGYTYGSAEIYDKDDKLVKAVRIQPYEGLKSSVISALANLVLVAVHITEAAVYQDFDYLTYKASYNAATTQIDETIPEGGYLFLTANPEHSEYVAVYNFVHLWTMLITSMKDMNPLWEDKLEFKDLKKTVEQAVVDAVIPDSDRVAEIAMNLRAFFKELDFSSMSTKEKAEAICKQFKTMLQNFNFDWEAFAEGVVEVDDSWIKTIGKYYVPMLTVPLETWDITNNLSNICCTLMDMSACYYVNSYMFESANWRKAYAEFLNESQEGMTLQMYYEKGKGRFALVNINDDDVPELLQIGEGDETIIWKYEDGKVQDVSWGIPTTDIVVFDYKSLRFFSDGRMVMHRKGDGFEYWEYYYEAWIGPNDYMVRYDAGYSQDEYYVREYDVIKMHNDFEEYAYRYWEGRCSDEVTESQYNRYVKNFNLDRDGYTTISESEVHSITPAEIKQVLGY